jgi:KamA family protein
MKYQSYTQHNWHQIPQYNLIPEALKKEIELTASVLPFKTNNYVVNDLIDWNNIENDPIFILNFPRKEMLDKKHYDMLVTADNEKWDDTSKKQLIRDIQHQLNPNPSGQTHNVPFFKGQYLHGMQHKYDQTVLFFPSQGQTCHAYCTFCFRWPQFAGISELKFAMKEADLLVGYLKEHKEVTDVLFTGGDPMTMSTSILRRYIEPLLEDGLEHIQTIRIGTKSLAYWPYRYLTDSDTNELLRLFSKVVNKGINLSFMAHFNHPVELSTPVVEAAITRLRSIGCQIRTQSPLLRHINDKAELWAEMWRRQVNLNCIPYYMFVERDTGAKAYFEIPLEQCWNIFREAYQKVSGVCRTVRGPSMSANPGKIQILGVTEISGEKVFVLRFLQGRGAHWVAQPFFARYDPDVTWYDDLKPAFGADKFFFEDEMAKIIAQEGMQVSEDLE